jgi:hypothetical protein
MPDKGYHATLKIPFLAFWLSERSLKFGAATGDY